jgi:membrane fusion protein, multidrug efflux system
MNHFRKTNTIVCIILIVLSSCSAGNDKGDTNANIKPLKVEGYKVVEEPFSNEVTTTANLMASEQVEIKAPIAGQVLAIYFKEGSSVREGQAIVRLDDRSWKAALIGIKAQLANAQKDYLRKKELLSIDGISQEEVDKVFTNVESLKSEMNQLEVNIGLANVTAPFSGKLGMRDFSIGAFLNQGDAITTLAATNELKVDFSLAQNLETSIKVGDMVQIKVGNDTLKAKVYAISPTINTNTRTLNVRAMLSQPSKNKILPGTYAQVIISSQKLSNALLVPTQSIVPSISEQTLYVSQNGKAKRITVTLGNRTADKVHVISGINEGDTVLTTGLLQMKDGMDLIFLNVK